MSVINEALKKAEHERARIPIILPFRRSARRTRARQLWLALAGIGVGVMLGGGIGSRVWVSSESPPLPAAEQGREPAPAVVLPQPVRARDDAPSRAAAAEAFQRGVRAEGQGSWDLAAQSYRDAIAGNPTLWEARNKLGNLYVRRHELMAALEQFQEILAGEPQQAVAWNNLGSVHLLLGEEALAIQEFLAALRIDAQYVTPYYNLASLHARRGDVDQALSFLTRAISLDSAVLAWLRQDSDFDRIRGSRGFQQLQAGTSR